VGRQDAATFEADGAVTMLSDKQKAYREMALGSSDAPVVCGASSYCSPLELYYKLHGELPRYSDEESQAQRIGSKIEPLIAELAAEELQINIRRAATKRHPTHAFMVANLDFEIVSNPKGPGIFEVKNRIGTKPYDDLPDDIQIQVAHQLAVTRREWGTVAVLFGFGVLKTYEVERDKELEEYLIEIEAKFMLRVENHEPPTEAWTPKTIDLLRRLYPRDSGQEIVLDEHHAINAAGFLQAKQEIEAAETKKALYEGLLKDALGVASVATIPGYKMSWKATKDGKKFDEELFAKDNPALYEQYMVRKPGYRVFRVKPSKEVSL
jgi:predicted phage-related endonuclease